MARKPPRDRDAQHSTEPPHTPVRDRDRPVPPTHGGDRPDRIPLSSPHAQHGDRDRPDNHSAYSDRCRHCNRPVHPNRDSDRCQRCFRNEQHPTPAQLREITAPDRDSPRPVPHREDDRTDPDPDPDTALAARERRRNRWGQLRR